MVKEKYNSLLKKFSKISKKKKIMLILAFFSVLLLIFVCSYKTNAIENEVEEKVSKVSIVKHIDTVDDEEIETVELVELNDEVEEVVIEEPVEENIETEEEVKNTEPAVKEEKVVTYKGKEVTVPVVEKAPVNDSEDSRQNSSTAGSATQTTVEEAKNVISNVEVNNSGSTENSDKTYEHISTSVGIDVSKWNGNINWGQVKSAGIDFAMIRAGYRGSTQGTIMEDPFFQKNIQGAIKNGIKVGIYFYSMARTEEEAIQEAAWTVSAIRKYSITYPVAYDLESWGTGRIADVSYSQLTKNAVAFLGYIRNSGYTPMMYASKYDFNNRWQKGKITGCKFWLAHYTKQTDYTGSYQMWQYSDKGSVSGISGYVDMNIAYFSYSKTEAPKHTCDYKFEKVLKEATCIEDGKELYRCECGDSKTEVIKATGHSFGEWKTIKNPTDDAGGEKVRVCEKCNLEEKEKIEKLKNNSINSNTTSNNTEIDNTVSNSIDNSISNNTINNTVNNTAVNNIENAVNNNEISNTTDTNNTVNEVINTVNNIVAENTISNEISNSVKNNVEDLVNDTLSSESCNDNSVNNDN